MERSKIIEALEEEEVEKEVEKEVEETKESEEDENDSIQAVKVKKPRTQKQIDAFAAVCAKRSIARQGRKEDRDQAAIVEKALLEQRIVQKAKKIVEKKIKAERILQDDPVSETKVPFVKKIILPIVKPPIVIEFV